MPKQRNVETDHGRCADTPLAIPLAGWWVILRRAWTEADRDNISVAAAGVAFLGLLALFPAMVAGTALYGLVADPASIARQIEPFAALLPPAGREILFSQLASLTAQKPASLGFGLLFSLIVALWSAGGGIRALMRSLNMAYGEEERRSFVRFAGTALVLTLGTMLMLAVMLAIVVALPAVLNFVGLDRLVERVVRLCRWPLLAAALILALSVIYRYGPCRRRAKWRWVSPGAVAATLLWLMGSAGFSLYISNFADYNATYGSLGAGMALLMWLYLGAYSVLLGAELDAAAERQTLRDTTVPPDMPIGQRGAVVADHKTIPVSYRS